MSAPLTAADVLRLYERMPETLAQSESVDVTPPAHEHTPVKGPLGVVVCAAPDCRMRVELPVDMPDYTGAVMARW